MSTTAPKPAVPDAEIAVGTKIDGYRVERIVRVRPGIDTVVEATHETDNERSLLTFPARDACATRESRRESLRLARLRSSISHPHLAPLLVVSENWRDPYLVTPALGKTLAERLEAGTPDIGETLFVLAQVAGALDLAAAHDLSHRDLTPAAIVLAGADPVQAQLTDFGLMLPTGGCSSLATLEGAGYRSPEAIRGEEPTARSSVYALACILYECLTGAPPYAYDRPLLTLHAHLVEPAPRISRKEARLPAALDAVVARGLAKEPGRRQDSAGELVTQAGAALGRRVRVPTPAPVVPAEKETDPIDESRRTRFATPWGRWASAAAACALVASLLSGFAIGGLEASGGPRPQRAVPVLTAAELAAARQRSDYLRSVNRSVESLDRRRHAGRASLRRARRARAQAAAANALARTYETARVGLPAPVTQSAGVGLGAGLSEAERAYRRLAGAARRKDLRAWRKARAQAVRSERDVERALSRL